MNNDVSLCLINRDDKEHLVRLITNARPYVDEIVVIDTGSIDDSVNAARDAGADTVRSMPELIHEDGIIRSFGEARQRSYDLATCQWQMWLDTDCDMQDWTRFPETIKKATELRNSKPEYNGLNLKMWIDYSWSPDRSQCTQSFTREYITHRDDGWKWKRPIHEYLKRVDGGKEVDVMIDYLRVIHLSQGGRGCVNDRNLKVLQRWEQSGGIDEDPIALYYYLGDEMLVRERYDEAFEYFNKVPSYAERAYWANRSSFRAARSLMGAKKYEQAVKYLQHSIEGCQDAADLHWELVRAHCAMGHTADARRAMEASYGKKTIMGEDPHLKTLMMQRLGLEEAIAP